jgi:hypothetical protein
MPLDKKILQLAEFIADYFPDVAKTLSARTSNSLGQIWVTHKNTELVYKMQSQISNVFGQDKITHNLAYEPFTGKQGLKIKFAKNALTTPKYWVLTSYLKEEIS